VGAIRRGCDHHAGPPRHETILFEEVQQAIGELEFFGDTHDRETLVDRDREKSLCRYSVLG
jgi:hypothetical protein